MQQFAWNAMLKDWKMLKFQWSMQRNASLQRKMQQKYAKVKSVLCQNATGIGLKCASMPQIVPLFLQKCYLKAETQMGHFCTKLPPETLQEIGNPVVPTKTEQQFWWVLLNLTEVSFSYDMLWYSWYSFSDLQKYPHISRFCCIASWIWVDSRQPSGCISKEKAFSREYGAYAHPDDIQCFPGNHWDQELCQQGQGPGFRKA